MEENIYIFGAHSRGQTFAEYVSFLYPQTKIVSFLVTDLSENEKSIGGIPVCDINDHLVFNTDYFVYVAVKSATFSEVESQLKNTGFKHIRHVDVELDRTLRSEYVRQKYAKANKEYLHINELKPNSSVCIYVASSAFDKQLQTQYNLTNDEAIIQVGTSLTDKRLENAAYFDNIGENISDKNKQFCELTALYWIWKNAQQDIVGLVHYRRHFLLPSNWLTIMEENNIDVILPVPLYVGPSLEGNYNFRHYADDLKNALDFISERDNTDAAMVRNFFSNTLYSPCNMFITRRKILCDLCNWMFPVLEHATALGGQKDDNYQNRYPGFLSERLMTYYFEYKRKDLKKIYADKNFLK